MSKIIEGRDLMFFVSDTSTASGYKSIAAATSCSLEVSLDTKDVTTKDTASGAWTTVTPNKLSWSGSSDNLFETGADGSDFDTLFGYMTQKKTVWVKFGSGKTFTDGSGWAVDNAMYQGTCIITSLSLTAGAEDNAQYSVSFTGTGALTKVSAS